jgi:hypothetical protein
VRVIPNGIDLTRYAAGDRPAARRRLGLPQDGDGFRGLTRQLPPPLDRCLCGMQQVVQTTDAGLLVLEPLSPSALNGLPRVRLEAPAEASGTATIAVQATGTHLLRRLLIDVDGVPWPSAAGLPLPGTSARWDGRIEVPLAAGSNRIEVAAEDAAGNETLDDPRILPADRAVAPAGPRSDGGAGDCRLLR